MIDLEGVTYRYRPEEAGPPALKDVTVSIPAGERVAVIGQNGSGKSTLLKLLTALVYATEGTVRVDGIESGPATRWDIRERVAPVFQDPDDQIVATRVADDIAFGPENLGLPPGEIRDRVEWALGVMQLEGRADAITESLSTAEKQRLAIAGALAMRPRVLVLDEPSAYLPHPSALRLLRTLDTVNRDTGATILFITHSMADAATFDRILVFDRGTLRLDGSPRAVFERREDLRPMGLDVPAAAQVAHALRSAGVDMPSIPIDGAGLDATVRAL